WGAPRTLSAREALMLWDERFKSSGVWQYVEQARAHMNASTMPTERGEQDALAYVVMALELLEERSSTWDAREISPAMLTNLGASVSNLANDVGSVNSGRYQWSQSTPRSDAVLDTLASWPPMKSAHYLTGLSSATD